MNSYPSILFFDDSDSDKSKKITNFLNINHISIQYSYNNFYNSQIIIEKFLPNEINKIGEGGFGTVYKFLYNILVAKKIINKENENIYKNEIKYLDLLNKSEVRNNVVHYYNSELDKNFDYYVIYLELCDGNLKDFREKIIKKNNGSFPLYMIQYIMKQINNVMEYLLIKKRLCYNDMKPDNILYKIIDEENDLYEFKLCDFGLVEEKKSKNDIANSVSGTINNIEDDKKNYYELYDLGNIMHYLFFGEEYNKNNKNFDEKIYNIKDQDFQFILKNTLTHDIQKIHVDEYFKANFFKKDRKDLIDGLNNNKIFKLRNKDVIKIAKSITKIKNPKFLDYTNNIIIENLSKDVEHFTSYIENDTFNFVCYNKKENQIEIYEENKEKYSTKEKNKIIKINEKIKNVNDILIYENYILLLSCPICYINIKNDFNKKFINKKNLFVKFITIEDKKIFIYLNENNEINSFEIEIKDNKFNIINEKLINNIEKCNEKINNFDCFKTSKNDILIYFLLINLYKFIIYLINK